MTCANEQKFKLNYSRIWVRKTRLSVFWATQGKSTATAIVGKPTSEYNTSYITILPSAIVFISQRHSLLQKMKKEKKIFMYNLRVQLSRARDTCCDGIKTLGHSSIVGFPWWEWKKRSSVLKEINYSYLASMYMQRLSLHTRRERIKEENVLNPWRQRCVFSLLHNNGKTLIV